MHPLTYVVFLAGLVGFGLFKFIQSFRSKNAPNGPPGPVQLPLLGRIHDLPIQFMWHKFYEWGQAHAKEHGFYQTEMLGAKFLIVTEEKVAEELLVKRARHNSDRPQIRSLFDSKSTHGSMEYLPLMGKNRRSCSRAR